jgi:hypothetical protein
MVEKIGYGVGPPEEETENAFNLGSNTWEGARQ